MATGKVLQSPLPEPLVPLLTPASVGASIERTEETISLERCGAVSSKGDNPCAREVGSLDVDLGERGLSFGEWERIFSSTHPEKGDSSGGALKLSRMS